MPKLKFHVGTGIVGSTKRGSITIDDDEWNDMDEESREKLSEELFTEWMWNAIDAGWEVEE